MISKNQNMCTIKRKLRPLGILFTDRVSAVFIANKHVSRIHSSNDFNFLNSTHREMLMSKKSKMYACNNTDAFHIHYSKKDAQRCNESSR